MKEKQNITDVMLGNLKEINGYYIDSKNQCNYSFIFAAVSIIVGFACIAITCISIFIVHTGNIVAIITAIGGVISEFVAASSIAVYKNASAQMSVYYRGLHENELILLAISTGEKVSADRDGVYTMLAEKIILRKSDISDVEDTKKR